MIAPVTLTLQIGPDVLVMGPPGLFGGRSDGRQIGRPGLHGREDARRWLLRACEEPGALIRLRQHLVLWTGDAHAINRVSDRDLPDHLSDLCARGSLTIWASRPMGGHDARALAQVDLQPASRGPIDTWSVGARIEQTLRRVPDHLPATARAEFEKLLTPGAIRVCVNVLSLWVSGHAFGISEVMDVLLLTLSTYAMRRSLRDLADKIGAVLEGIISAKRDTDLDAAARDLASVVTLIGINAFGALISHAASKASKGALKARKAPLRRNVPAA